MIVVTGGAGFIGSGVLWKLNAAGVEDIIVVDELGTTEKWRNLVKRRFYDYVHKDTFREWLRADRVPFPVRAIVHMGACSATTERDADYLIENNYRYSCTLADWALRRGIRCIYASSAATYGDGTQGFADDEGQIGTLCPINVYGYSKQLFDLWVLRRGAQGNLVGIKFFNVFGPNEYHKGEMASVVFKAYHQIRQTGRLRLFKSYRPEYTDGGQRRDFVYVKDCVEVLWWLLEHPAVNGIFNLGTGHARTWNELAAAVFGAMGLSPQIDYIEMPAAIREQYQYFTQARMERLAACGCPLHFTPLEEAVADYVRQHLAQPDPYL